MGNLFGTDGIRGAANSELTPELVFRLGAAAARYFTEESGKAPAILIGMDTRRSGSMLEAAIIAGITSAGGDAYAAGVIPTPGVAYLVKKYGMDGGAVISASHNPFFDNGIKFFCKNGHKTTGSAEDKIESMVCGTETVPRMVGSKIGIRREVAEAADDYIGHIKTTVGEVNFQGVNVTLDCANGAAYRVGPALFYDLGADLRVIANDPDGENINFRCGSTHLEELIEMVRENGSDIGIAFDGDADRCLAVDENGTVVDGDQIMAILTRFYKGTGALWKDSIVSTVMSNIGLEIMCAKNGVHLEKTNVGDKYVLERMLEKGYMLGGEQSGHIINLMYGTTGDGLITSVQLIRIMKETGKKLSELSSAMEKYPQVLRNARVSNERKGEYLTSTEIANVINALEERFKNRGRVLIRPSGTEPLIRVMIEGRDLAEITSEAETLAKLIEDVLT